MKTICIAALAGLAACGNSDHHRHAIAPEARADSVLMDPDSAASPTDSDKAQLHAYLNNYEIPLKAATPFYTDLDQDGDLDAIVRLNGHKWCNDNSGCMFLFLEKKPDHFAIVSTVVTAQNVRVRPSKHKGWHDIWVTRIHANAEIEPYIQVMHYNGRHYERVRNQNMTKIAQALAATTEIYIQDGYDLRLQSYRPTDDCAGCYVFVFAFDHYGDPNVAYSIDVAVTNSLFSIVYD